MRNKGHVLRVILIYAMICIIAATVVILIVRRMPSTKTSYQTEVVIEGTTEYTSDTVCTEGADTVDLTASDDDASGAATISSNAAEGSSDAGSDAGASEESDNETSATVSAHDSAKLESLMKDIAEHTKEEN